MKRMIRELETLLWMPSLLAVVLALLTLTSPLRAEGINSNAAADGLLADIAEYAKLFEDWRNYYRIEIVPASSDVPDSAAPDPLPEPKAITPQTKENETVLEEPQASIPQTIGSGVGGNFSIQIKDQSTGPQDLGTLEIVYTGGEENYTFKNGGISLALDSSTSGVVQFDDARILNGDYRWTWTDSPTVALDSVEDLFAFSVLSPGLTGQGSRVFAEIDYYLIGQGNTILQLLPSGIDPLVDGPYGDVSQQVYLGNMCLGDNCGALLASAVPEPSPLAIVGLLAIGMASLRCEPVKCGFAK